MFESNFYRRNLPHWQPPNAEYFITFRLKGSLPRSVIRQLKAAGESFDNKHSDSDQNFIASKIHAKFFKKYDTFLDSFVAGPTWLANSEIAGIVQEALFYRDKNEYDLYAFCIMSNHVHVVFRLLKNTSEEVLFPVTEVLRKLKSYTALRANQKLGRTGAFWHSESYDRVIRNEFELKNTIQYVLHNPVKIKLVSHWKEWNYSYCKPKFLDMVA